MGQLNMRQYLANKVYSGNADQQDIIHEIVSDQCVELWKRYRCRLGQHPTRVQFGSDGCEAFNVVSTDTSE